RLATSSSARFGAASPTQLCERFRTSSRRAIAPATAALQYMHDAADDSAIVRPLDAPDIRRQVRLDPLPLLIAQPKQVAAHDPNPLPKTNQDRIVRAEKLMSSDPSCSLPRLITFALITRASFRPVKPCCAKGRQFGDLFGY